MKLVPCLSVGSLLLSMGVSAFANPPAQDQTAAASDCSQSFAGESEQERPDLKIFPPPEELPVPVVTAMPRYPYLVSSRDIPEILKYLDQTLALLESEPSRADLTNQAHHFLTRLIVWARGRYERLSWQTYFLEQAEPEIHYFHQAEELMNKRERFARLGPLMSRLQFFMRDARFEFGLRTQMWVLQREFQRHEVDIRLRSETLMLRLLTPEQKWQELLRLEEKLADHLYTRTDSNEHRLDIFRLAALYTDEILIARLMNPVELNIWKARLDLLDRHISELILLDDQTFMMELPEAIYALVDPKINRFWRMRRPRQTEYFLTHLREFRETYASSVIHGEAARFIDQFLDRMNVLPMEENAYNHIAELKELIEKFANHWKSRDQLEKTEAGRALWLAIRLITVF